MPDGVDGPVLISGFLPIADELRALADEAGFTVTEEADGDVPWLILECGPPEDDAAPLQGAPRALLCAEGALQALDQGAAAAGFHWVADAPGLVLGRIVAQVINECAFAIGESIGTAADIDAGMKLGMNYPTGPLEWADEIGLDHIVMILDGLREEYSEERYRTAPLLRRITAFHDHEHFERDHGEP